MIEDLKGKVAIVTGAARGIGREISVHLAGRGADLAVCDIDISWLEDTVKICKGKGVKIEPFGVDVRNTQSVDSCVKKVLEIFGKIDILINNAGITRDGLLVRMSDEDWDDVISTNLKGVFLFMRAVSKIMMKQRSGVIVNIASVIGIIGNAGQCNYAASKAGVIALTRSAAKELASRNIRVNAVAPGFINTKMTEVLPEEKKAEMLKLIPLGRFGEVSDVAKVVGFLCSEDSSYITGQVLTVCGGMVMQ